MSMARNTSYNQRAPPPPQEDVFMTLVRRPQAVGTDYDRLLSFLACKVQEKKKKIYVLSRSPLP